MSRPDRAEVAKWIDPDDEPAPTGRKLFILTIGGVATVGNWDADYCVAWAPLLTVPPKIRAKLMERYAGKRA